MQLWYDGIFIVLGLYKGKIMGHIDKGVHII